MNGRVRVYWWRWGAMLHGVQAMGMPYVAIRGLSMAAATAVAQVRRRRTACASRSTSSMSL